MITNSSDYLYQLKREVSHALTGKAEQEAGTLLRAPRDRYAELKASQPAVIVDFSEGAIKAWETAKAEREAAASGNAEQKKQQPYGLSEELLTVTDTEQAAIAGTGAAKAEGGSAVSGGAGTDKPSDLEQLKERLKEAQQRLREAQQELAKATSEVKGAEGGGAQNAAGSGTVPEGADEGERAAVGVSAPGTSDAAGATAGLPGATAQNGVDPKVQAAQDKVRAAQSEVAQLQSQISEMESAGT